MDNVAPLRLPARRIYLDNGWKLVRVRDARRAPRYKRGEYVIFSKTGRIHGRMAADAAEALPEAKAQP